MFICTDVEYYVQTLGIIQKKYRFLFFAWKQLCILFVCGHDRKSALQLKIQYVVAANLLPFAMFFICLHSLNAFPSFDIVSGNSVYRPSVEEKDAA